MFNVLKKICILCLFYTFGVFSQSPTRCPHRSLIIENYAACDIDLKLNGKDIYAFKGKDMEDAYRSVERRASIIINMMAGMCGCDASSLYQYKYYGMVREMLLYSLNLGYNMSGFVDTIIRSVSTREIISEIYSDIVFSLDILNHSHIIPRSVRDKIQNEISELKLICINFRKNLENGYSIVISKLNDEILSLYSSMLFTIIIPLNNNPSKYKKCFVQTMDENENNCCY